MVTEIEYFLDASHGAKFDFWAFHGYHMSEVALPNVVHFPPNMKPRSNQYAGVWGATEIRKRLDANGWQRRPIIDTVSGVALLWSKLNHYRYSGHVSGAYDDFSQVWVERFEAEGNELYVFFKPFKYLAGQSIALDGEQLAFSLSLPSKPAKLTLTDLRGATSSVAPEALLTLQASNVPAFLEASY